MKTEFVLTKCDSSDFDRDAVSKRLGLVPAESNPPRMSKGKTFDIDFENEDLCGMSVLTDSEPPYSIILHADWAIEFEKSECWDIKEQIYKMEQLLCGKRCEFPNICKEYDLQARLIVRIYAEDGNLPIMEIPAKSVAFWSEIGAGIVIDVQME